MESKQHRIFSGSTRYRNRAVALSLLLALAIAFTPLFSITAAAADNGDTVINFVEITDTHGNIYTTSNGKDQYKMAFLANTFNSMRTPGKNDLVVLSGGDMFQGTAVSNLLKGSPLIEAMNAMKFDAMALGNHEFDWGLDQVIQNGKLKNSDIPVLACNVFDKKTGKLASEVSPYTIVEKEGKRIALIGAVDDLDFPASILQSLIVSYDFKDAATMINQCAKEIMDGKKADAVVVVSHIGAVYNEKTKQNVGNLVDVTSKLDPNYVKAVFGGHTHQIVTGIAPNGIPYGIGYKEGRGYVSMQMTFKADGSIATSPIQYNDILKKNLNKPETGTNPELDSAITAITDKAIQDVKPVLSEVVATTPTDLTRTMSQKPYGDSSLGNWVTDMVRKDTKADFAINNNGGIRADIEKGNITMGDMYSIMPFDNTLVTVKMTGAQIVKALEQGIQDTKGKGMQVSGLTFQYDPSKPNLARVFNVKDSKGKPIDLKKTYTVGTNNFVGTGGDNMDVFNEPNVKKSYVDTYIIARDSLVKAAKEAKVVNAAVDNRISQGKMTSAPAAAGNTKPSSKPAHSNPKTGSENTAGVLVNLALLSAAVVFVTRKNRVEEK
jgi:2',3'-cyclic-nucleotide 2'-phosphodiesterase/3'-nucleotidase/5'-nucleotidase